MRCPCCDEPAITFWRWARGANAFRHHCDVCGAALRGDRVVWAGFVPIVAVGLAIVIGVPLALGLKPSKRWLLAFAPVLLAGGYATYCVGAYQPWDDAS